MTSTPAAIAGERDRRLVGAARWLRRHLPWFVASLALVGCAVASVGWWQAGRAAAEHDRIRQVAGRGIAALTSWDATDLDGVREAVAEFGTDRFQREADDVFDAFSSGLEQAQVTSRSEVLDLAVTEVHDGSATALGTVRQRAQNASAEAAEVTCWGARASLLEVGGRWRVDQVHLFGPNSCEGVAG